MASTQAQATRRGHTTDKPRTHHPRASVMTGAPARVTGRRGEPAPSVLHDRCSIPGADRPLGRAEDIIENMNSSYMFSWRDRSGEEGPAGGAVNGPLFVPDVRSHPLARRLSQPIRHPINKKILAAAACCLAYVTWIWPGLFLNVTNIGAGFMTALHKFHSGTRERF